MDRFPFEAYTIDQSTSRQNVLWVLPDIHSMTNRSIE